MCMHDSTTECRPSLSPSQIADLRLAALQMSGPKRRAFEAEMTLKYCGGAPYGETLLGLRPQNRGAWLGRETHRVHLSWCTSGLQWTQTLGRPSIRRRPQRFVDSPMRMRNKTRRSARA